jgi:hypothetical protein
MTQQLSLMHNLNSTQNPAKVITMLTPETHFIPAERRHVMRERGARQLHLADGYRYPNARPKPRCNASNER